MNDKKQCAKNIKDSFIFKKFPRYKQIRCYLRRIVKQYPSIARIETIGHSYCGRPIEMMVLASAPSVKKAAVLIDAGIHAREWITNTTALYVIHYLTQRQDLLGYFDYYIIPSINPDGYEYSHTRNRLWRKNMNPNGACSKKCWGVDLNRNFPYGYGLKNGSSGHPKNLMYRGEYPLSEPETRSLNRVMRKYREYIKLYIALHTFGNCILFPWGYTKKCHSDDDLLRTCGNLAKRAMYQVNGRKYKVGSVAQNMYLTSGNAVDHAKGTYKIKFVYTIELQAGGKSGFEISPKKIPEIAEEVMVGIETMLHYVYKYTSGMDMNNDRKVDIPCKKRRMNYCRK